MKFKVMLLAVLGLGAGIGGGLLLERHVLAHPAAATPAQEERKILYWWDPMLPGYKSDKPGKSPMGMEMVPVYEGEEPGAGPEPDVVTLSPAMVNNLGVRTALVERATLVPTIETFGTVSFDEGRTAHVHVRADGWVERLHHRVVGETVEKGDLLFEMFSPKLASAAFELLRELQRGSAGRVDGAQSKLRALGVSERQIEEIQKAREVPEHIKVFAPQSGVIVAHDIAQGMYVEPDMTLMSITELDTVWVLAEVLESQGGLVHAGMTGEVRVAGRPERVWTGTVDYIYPDLRTDTRTIQLRLPIANADRVLKPNMFASVRLATTPRENVLAVPSEALIRTGESQRLVLALGDGRFRPVPVKAGLTIGDKVEILQGVNEGDRVVTSAQFLIDSESSLAAGFARMQPAEAPAAQAASAEGEMTALMREADQAPAVEAWTTATVNAAPTPDRKVNLSHGPIPAIGWPAMTMDFAVHPAVPLDLLKPKAKLRIGLAKAPDGGYWIVAAKTTEGT